jgi:hypothetical protein
MADDNNHKKRNREPQQDTMDDNDNPSVRMTPQDNPVKSIKNGSKTESEGFAETLEWCRRVAQLEHCPRLSGNGTGDTECTCLRALRPQVQVEGKYSIALCMVARWSCHVASLDNGARSSLEIEWIKRANLWAKDHSHGATKRTSYVLQLKATDPSSSADNSLYVDAAYVQPFRVCKHAMMLILGVGKTRWAASAKHAAANTFPVHGLIGKAGNKLSKKKARVDSDLNDFFAKLQDEAQVPGVGEEEQVELPPYMSKRGLYKKFCWERGWKLDTDEKGNITRSSRPYDTDFPEGSERKDISAWSSFAKYWKEKHPNLKIRKL